MSQNYKQNRSKEEGKQKQNNPSKSCKLEFLSKITEFKFSRKISISPQIVLLTILKASIAIHTFIGYKIVYGSAGEAGQNKPKDKQDGLPILVLVQVLLYLLKLVELATIYALLRSKQHNIFQDLYQVIMNNFSLMVELDLTASALLLLANFQLSIGGFLITACIYLFNTVFLMNYFDRKDVLYLSSIEGSFFINITIVLNYLLNSIFINYYPTTFLFIDAAFICLVSIWFCTKGFLISNKIFQLSMRQIIIIKISTCLVFIDYMINQQQSSFTNDMIKFILSYLVLFFTISKVFSFINIFQSLVKKHQQGLLKQFDVLLTVVLHYEQTLESSQKDYLINSLIKNHKDTNCFKCHAMRLKYDPIDHNYSSEEKPNMQIQLKYYLKCLHQESLEQNMGNCEFILDYCEFILSQFKNSYIICKWISTIDVNKIGFWSEVRLYKLKYLMQQCIQSINKLSYEGKLELQSMMRAQQSFDKIQQNVQRYITMNVEIWGLIHEDSINYTEVKLRINAALQLIHQTNKQWSQVSKYLSLQKRWNYIYINYTYFILNQQFSIKNIDQLRQIDQDQYFKGQTIILYQHDKRSKLVSEKIVFDRNTIYLRAAIKQGSITVISVSKYFSSFIGYSDAEIIGCQIDILVDGETKETHKQKVKQWLQNGYSNNEAFYNPRFTYLTTKYNQEMPILKYYKLFISLTTQNMLQSICLLKINSAQPRFVQLESQILIRKQTQTKELQQIVGSKNEKNIKIQNNIFIKGQNFLTNQDIKQIQLSKKSIRFLTFCIISLLIIMLVIINRDSKTVTNNITQFLNFLNLYRFPMALSKNYMKNFLNLGTQSSVINQIKFGTQNVIAFNSDPLTLMTLFDQNLNEPQLFKPFLNDSFNKGSTYNQIQIYSLVISNIISLSKLPINRTGYDFTMLNMYLVPSFDHMMNKTKIKFHKTFQSNLQIMLMDQAIIAAIEFTIFMAIIIFVLIQIKAYLRKSKNILQIIFEFSGLNVKRIKKYWRNTLKQFKKLNLKNKTYCQPTILNLRSTKGTDINLDIDYIKENIQREQTISFNKKSKVVFETAKAKGKFLKYVIIIGVSLFLLLSALLGVEAFNIVRIQALLRFERDGYYFLEYYPATSVLGHALMERYYNQLYPKEIQFYPQRYAEYISDMKIIGESKYISEATDPSSSYYQKQKNYMFGNPCTFSPQVLVAANSNLAKCLSIYNRTLSNGLSTFLRAAQPQLQSYINRNSTLTSTQLDTLTSALTLVAFYVTDGITTWAAEFSTKVKQFKQTGNIICIVAAVLVLIVHVFFCQYLLFYFLAKDYRFVREVFDKMIPAYILQSQKICRQKFIMEGIIKTQ